MTLDEAIKHAEEVADEKEAQAGFDTDYLCYQMSDTERNQCKKCAKEHRQLAEWLKELKDYRERIPSYEAGYNDAKREIALSGEYQRAYERGKKDAEQTRWIPVSEKYEHHIDHTDCIWYGDDSGCPVTCSQYRDGWNDAMDYIFKNGESICGSLGYADEFSPKHDYRKPNCFYIGNTSFKVSHVRKLAESEE